MRALPEDWEIGGFGIYIHWPYCAAKCPYCDFNSHVASFIDHAAWRAAYLEELERGFAITGKRVVQSVFFGGGTPSLMEPGTVSAVLDQISALWPLANDIEVTLEANPTSVEASKFAAFRAGGVNRVSMGVQALVDDDLKRLGRLHSAQEALAAFDVARGHFDRVSFDLIYGRQDQTLSDWERELNCALDLAVDHLSLYQLTVEDGTAFGDRYKAGKLLGLPSDDLGADMYELTQALCSDRGLPAYEVSNHAADQAHSKHNLIYWRYGDYLGIGPGAHGRLTRNGSKRATEQTRHPQLWLRGERDVPHQVLTLEDQGSEFLLMGMRLVSGVDLRRFERLTGNPISPETVSDLQELGLVDVSGHTISATKSGFAVLNALIAKLLTG